MMADSHSSAGHDLVAVSRRAIVARSALQLLLRSGGAAAGVVVAGVLARTLSPADFGTLMFAMLLTTTGSAIADLGMTQVAVREMAQRPDDREGIAGALVFGRTLLGGVALGITSVVAWLTVSDVEDFPAVFIVLLSLALTGFGGAMAVAQARLRPELSSLLVLIQSVAWLLFVLLVAFFEAGLLTFAIAFLMSNVLQALLSWRVASKLTRISWDHAFKNVRILIKLGLPLGLAGLAVTAYYRIGGLILFADRGAEESAVFSASFRFIEVLQILPATLAVSLGPILAIRRMRAATPTDVGTAFSFCVRLMLAVVVPVAAGLSACSGEVLRAVYGAPYAKGADTLSLLAIAFIFIALGYIITSVVIALDMLRPYFWVVFSIAVVNVVANFVAISYLGSVGAAVVTVATEFLVVFSLFVLLRIRQRLTVPMSLWVKSTLLGASVWLAARAGDYLGGFVTAVILAVVVAMAVVLTTRLCTYQDFRTALSARKEADA